MEARRAEEDDGVLDALATKARERLLVFRQNAQDPAIGAVEELLVFVRQGRSLELLLRLVVFISHAGNRNNISFDAAREAREVASS